MNEIIQKIELIQSNLRKGAIVAAWENLKVLYDLVDTLHGHLGELSCPNCETNITEKTIYGVCSD